MNMKTDLPNQSAAEAGDPERVFDGMVAAPVPDFFAAKVMARWRADQEKNIPLLRQPGLALAAVFVLLVLNFFALQWISKPSKPVQTATHNVILDFAREYDLRGSIDLTDKTE
jgi:hypothetical protein